MDVKDKAWNDLREFMQVAAETEVTFGFDVRVMAYFIKFEKWVQDKDGYIRFKWCSIICLEDAILGGLMRWRTEYTRELEKYGQV